MMTTTIKHKTQTYIRYGVIPLEVGLAALQAEDKKVELLGLWVNTKSLRLRTFRDHGLSCPCGRTGTHFAIESTPGKQMNWHINLWATDPDGTEQLMTCDHIVPLSKGGADQLRNTQTMCYQCNQEKKDNSPVAE